MNFMWVVLTVLSGPVCGNFKGYEQDVYWELCYLDYMFGNIVRYFVERYMQEKPRLSEVP